MLDDTESAFYLSKDKLNSLLKKSEQKKGKLSEQISKCEKNIKTKEKMKDKLLDMHLEETITKEEFVKRRAEIDKEIASIQELLDQLTSDINYENEKNKTSSEIYQLISEGKAEGFNEELFNLLVNKIEAE